MILICIILLAVMVSCILIVSEHFHLFYTLKLIKSHKQAPIQIIENKNKNKLTVNFKNRELVITGEKEIDLKAVTTTKSFVDWLNEFQNKDLYLEGIHIQCVDMFGPRVGFIKFIAKVLKDGKQIPGIVFMRGGSVGILTIIEHKGIEYALTTVQARTPIGQLFTEIPAGMLDDNGNFQGQAAKEMKEETELIIKEENLIDLTNLAYGNKYKGMIPSAGGCDEFIRLFVYKHNIEDDIAFNQLQGKCTGLVEHGEIISLNLIELDKLWHETSDAKALSALFLYEKLKSIGKIQ